MTRLRISLIATAALAAFSSSAQAEVCISIYHVSGLRGTDNCYLTLCQDGTRTVTIERTALFSGKKVATEALDKVSTQLVSRGLFMATNIRSELVIFADRANYPTLAKNERLCVLVRDMKRKHGQEIVLSCGDGADVEIEGKLLDAYLLENGYELVFDHAGAYPSDDPDGHDTIKDVSIYRKTNRCR